MNMLVHVDVIRTNLKLTFKSRSTRSHVVARQCRRLAKTLSITPELNSIAIPADNPVEREIDALLLGQMSSQTKNCIRVAVIAGVLAWPVFETYRLWVTTQQMQQALALERTVRAKLEATRAKHVEVATTPPTPSQGTTTDTRKE